LIRIRRGLVLKIIAQRPGISEVLVDVEGQQERAVCYENLTGPVQPGDEVALNTTAVHKKLGTGGVHFVIANHSITATDAPESGHIMKMRYAPCQVKVLAVEEEASPHAQAMRDCTSLSGTPVLIGGLHSMLGPAAAALHVLDPSLRVVYLMTDGGALPLAFSRLVHQLKEKGFVQATVTCGHAFGGDFEAINIYSGLLAAKVAAQADVIIAVMGPGVVGTGSTFGFTGLEQGQIVNAVHTLGGLPVAIPRISFSDQRLRHRGISHHTVTALTKVALVRACLPIPSLEPPHMAVILEQLEQSGLSEKHDVRILDGEIGLEALQRAGLQVTTMGRGPQDDPAFFRAVGAAARFVTEIQSGV